MSFERQTIHFLASKLAPIGGWDEWGGRRCRSRRRWVRLAARGDTVEHSFSTPTEEGYSATSSTYTRLEDGVKRECYHSGSDCDGPLSGGHEDFCPFEELASCKIIRWNRSFSEPERPTWGRVPNWQEIPRSGWQRDVFAERMGY